MASRLREVEVVVRDGGEDSGWVAEVDEDTEVGELLPELVAALKLEGDPDDYAISATGTLARPRLLVERRGRLRVGNVRPLDSRRA